MLPETRVGDIRETDFRNPVAVAQDINGFVSQETRGLIRELVTPSHVARALLVLVNAVYFKGAWEDPFDRRFTKPADFFCSSQTLTPSGKVQMMSDSARYNYYDSPTLGVEVLELPYAKSTMSMLAILPKPGKTVDSVVDSLNLQTLGTIINSLSKTSMILEFPRFRMEQSLEDELKAALGAIGITELFSRNGNLSGFSKLLTRNAGDIVHKAVVDVTEEGTEAAAATGVITPLSLPPRLSFNRPFVFMIIDKRLGLVFFTGIYRTPV
ncbi:intracellular coagulation inhibitor 2-like [Oratosquilla oratoria]|uniref:intracellular coagulation inhibitor 2-like n=1 Tax=Oratosquilla oratoria TaxID=337810 RepID=UPI003F769C2B